MGKDAINHRCFVRGQHCCDNLPTLVGTRKCDSRYQQSTDLCSRRMLEAPSRTDSEKMAYGSLTRFIMLLSTIPTKVISWTMLGAAAAARRTRLPLTMGGAIGVLGRISVALLLIPPRGATLAPEYDSPTLTACVMRVTHSPVAGAIRYSFRSASKTPVLLFHD